MNWGFEKEAPPPKIPWKTRVAAFLEEYEKLCRKHNIDIQGCGCCGSPWLQDVEDAPEQLERSLLAFKRDTGLAAPELEIRDMLWPQDS